MSASFNLPSPFEFSDFGAYFSAVCRTSAPKASHRTRDEKWAKSLGYSSRRTVGMIRSGRRLPSAAFIRRLGRYLGQSESEQQYLELLIGAKSNPAPDILEEMNRRKRQQSSRVLLDEAQLNYVAHWYTAVMKQMIGAPGFDPTIESIRQRLNGKVDVTQIKRSLENMLHIGVIEKVDSPESYRIRAERTTTPVDIPIFALRQHHMEQLGRAREALREESVDRREFLSLTLAFDPSRLKEAKGMLRDFAEEFDRRFSSAQHRDIFQLCMQFFPQTAERKPYEN